MRSSSFKLLLLLATLGSSASQAANLMEIFEEALVQDPQLLAAEAKLKADKEIVAQSRAGLLPNLTASGDTGIVDREFPLSTDPASREERFNSNSYGARLTQPLIRLDRWYEWLSAKATRRGAIAEYGVARQDLILRVATAYFDILRAEDNLDTSVAQEKAFKRQLEQTQERFDVGLIAITDVHESQAAYDNARVNRITQEEARDNSFAALETLTNQIYSDVEPLNKQMPIVGPNPAVLQEWVQGALEKNIGLQVARHQVKAAKQEVRRQKSAHLPTLDAVASYSKNETGGRSFLGNESEIKDYRLELSVPLYAGGATQSRVRQAHYRMLQAKQEVERQLRLVKQNVKNQHRTVSSDVLRVGARKLALKSSQSALEATQGGYEVGTRNIVDVLQSQRLQFEAQRDYYNAIYDYILNSLELKQIGGTLNEADLVALNQWLVAQRPAPTP